MYEHYNRILTEGTALLSQFQRPFHSSNCPAVAAAVQRFLETSNVVPARDVARGFGCEDSGTAFVSTDIPNLLGMAAAGGHGFQVVVGATAPGRQHYANIVHIGEHVYYVDAFTRPGVVSAPNDLSWLSWATALEYSRRYSCRLVPT
jgi:hypothetical protein